MELREIFIYIHPIAMSLGLLLALLTLRSGLALRRWRVVKQGARAPLKRKHLLLAKINVAWISTGFVFGPIAMGWALEKDVFQSTHAGLGATALVLWIAAAILGHRLEIGQATPPREVHLGVGLGAILFSAIAAVFGYSLLP